MRDFFILCFVSLFITYVLTDCANVQPPTGGPKDTIPPTLVKSIPENKSLNFKGKSVELEYDEYLTVDNLKKQLIITPIIDQEYESRVRKHSVEIIFPESLQDSTTYTFNFQNSIKDITEGNVTKDNVIAFSTGNYIDSIHINGKIKNLFTNQPLPGYTVCLYKSGDTLDIFNSKPMYLTRSDERGRYLIENIKNGFYKLYAYNDLNSNLVCDIPKEIFGFIPDTLDLNQNLDSVFIDVFFVDIRPLEIQRSGPAGQYFEIKTNKDIIDYNIDPVDSTLEIYHNFGDDKRTIRIYNTFAPNDSIQFYFTAVDSIDQEVRDTLYAKFPESKRKKIEFSYSFTPSNNADITDHFNGKFIFNKPVLKVNLDSLYFIYDSTTFQYIKSDSMLMFNKKRDRMNFSVELFYTEYLEKLAANDTATQSEGPRENKLAGKSSSGRNQGKKLVFHIGKGAIISVDRDSMESNNYKYNKLNSEEYGIIRGNVITLYSNYLIQLAKGKKMEVIKETWNDKTYTFNHIEPGEYKIRVFIDEDNNGKWDPGNVLLNKAHEPVYFLPDEISIRANWELTDIFLEF